ncbi:MAG: 16S rRNA (cytosine(1402)-N(4))-methyltransferase RsmH [Parcubacteria group bacterium]|nr:16S rRNA (cytosine(1402)-N(4))-methyltransferase RsmH [Parcubacteria group bacterium]
MYTTHQPVLLTEVIAHLNLRPGDNCIDCTLGSGGHSQAILEATSPDGRLLGIDADSEAISYCRQALSVFAARLELAQGNFVDLANIVAEKNFSSVQGILLDLGVSTHQITVPTRGFSFQQTGELDMRFDRQQPDSALEVVNDFKIEELSSIFKKFGEIKEARRLAIGIEQKRRQQKITTTAELVAIVKESLRVRPEKANQLLARVFQAIRIAVNNELENLSPALQSALDVLASEGRLVVISYHSLEDRIVKELFREQAQACQCPPEVFVCRCNHQPKIKLITKKPIIPTPSEIKTNPRSRSAKMRVVEKI